MRGRREGRSASEQITVPYLVQPEGWGGRVGRVLPGGATCGTLVLKPALGGDADGEGWVVWLLPRPNASNQTAEVSSDLSVRLVAVRADEIGPILRELTFEPVREQPAPVEPAPVTPEREPKEPRPNRP
jgi:hypothetical protein